MPESDAGAKGRARPKRPAWLEVVSWKKAFVDLSSFSPGVRVVLKEASDARADEMRECTEPIPGTDRVRILKGYKGAACRAYVDSIEGPEEGVLEVFGKKADTVPKENAPSDKWEGWLSGISTRVVTRVLLGIEHFSGASFDDDGGDEGNADAPTE